jgi:hypothetical protein
MTTQRNPENKQEHRPHDLGQIIAGQNQPGSRELIEEQLDAMQGANLTATIKAFNGAGRGSYFVIIGNSSEYNEISISLYDSPRGKPIANVTGLAPGKDDK